MFTSEQKVPRCHAYCWTAVEDVQEEGDKEEMFEDLEDECDTKWRKARDMVLKLKEIHPIVLEIRKRHMLPWLKWLHILNILSKSVFEEGEKVRVPAKDIRALTIKLHAIISAKDGIEIFTIQNEPIKVINFKKGLLKSQM